MRPDLLEAQACVDWTVSQLPSFQDRLLGWVRANVHVVVKEEGPKEVHNPVVIAEKTPLPLEFNVEAGAYAPSP